MEQGKRVYIVLFFFLHVIMRSARVGFCCLYCLFFRFYFVGLQLAHSISPYDLRPLCLAWKGQENGPSRALPHCTHEKQEKREEGRPEV